MSQQLVYKFFDGDGVLLYVGVTSNSAKRFSQHFSKDWWPDVRRVEMDPYEDRTAALAAEKAFIIERSPLHNIMHNAGRRMPMRQQEDKEGAARPAISMITDLAEYCDDLERRLAYFAGLHSPSHVEWDGESFFHYCCFNGCQETEVCDRHLIAVGVLPIPGDPGTPLYDS